MLDVKRSFKKGLGFGLASGVITTLGLMVGLHSGTQSKIAVLGGILFIAIADALSDALGIHISEESEEKTSKSIWESTFSTFFCKLIVASTFVIPVLFFPLSEAILVSIIWGAFLLTIFSYYLARQKNEKPHKVILEHLIIAVLVIIVTHYLGDWVATLN
jgi:VIT1/CCC1 family predicted Fe2+/Mn2+ transporter